MPLAVKILCFPYCLVPFFEGGSGGGAFTAEEVTCQNGMARETAVYLLNE